MSKTLQGLTLLFEILDEADKSYKKKVTNSTNPVPLTGYTTRNMLHKFFEKVYLLSRLECSTAYVTAAATLYFMLNSSELLAQTVGSSQN